jgi:hypothetical protein
MAHALSSASAEFWICAFVAEVDRRAASYVQSRLFVQDCPECRDHALQEVTRDLLGDDPPRSAA